MAHAMIRRAERILVTIAKFHFNLHVLSTNTTSAAKEGETCVSWLFLILIKIFAGFPRPLKKVYSGRVFHELNFLFDDSILQLEFNFFPHPLLVPVDCVAEQARCGFLMWTFSRVISYSRRAFFAVLTFGTNRLDGVVFKNNLLTNYTFIFKFNLNAVRNLQIDEFSNSRLAYLRSYQ